MPSGARIVLRVAAEADVPTPDADQVALFMDTDLANAPAYKDELGVVTALQGADGELSYLDHGNTGASEDVDASAANVHRLVFNAATVTITTSGWPAAGTPALVRLEVVQDGTGGRLATWPGAFVWGTPGAPTLQTAAGAVDFVDLFSIDGGATIYASVPNRTGATGATGTAGVNGGPIAIPYAFSTTTTDSDPGNGTLRFDNATTASVTKIRADLLDSGGATVTAILDSLDDSTNTLKGHIRLTKASDPTKWWLGSVSAVDSSSGYRNITVAYIAQSGASPFSNGDALILTFARAGDVGASGTASVGTDPIFDAKGDLPVGTGADASAKLTVGANGTRPIAASGETTGIKWSFPPGWEFSYVEFTDVSVTGTTEGGAQTVVASASIVLAETTDIIAELFTPRLILGTAAGNGLVLDLYVDSTIQGRAGVFLNPASAATDSPLFLRSGKLTLTAGTYTITWKAWRIGANATVSGGAGGTGTNMKGYGRFVKGS